MTSYRAGFQSQLAAIMEALTKAAVAEICGLVDGIHAALQLEISRSRKENEALRRKLELIQAVLARGNRGHRGGNGGGLGDITAECTLVSRQPKASRPGGCGRVLVLEASAEGPTQPDPAASEPIGKDRDVVLIKEDREEEEEEEEGVGRPPEEEEEDEEEFRNQSRKPSGCFQPKQGIKHSAEPAEPETSALLCGLQERLGGCPPGPGTGSAPGPRSPWTGPLDWSLPGWGLGAAPPPPLGAGPEPDSLGRQRRFACGFCGKRFASSRGLETHVRVHTGERPFGCAQCGRRFTQAGHLKTHRSVHTGERPFACQRCGKRFAGKQNLRIHQHRHHAAEHAGQL
ncbi:uncharacterized protein ACNS7B_020513 [Menidia menidia]